MFTVEEIRDIVSQCSYEDWLIEVKMDNNRPYLQIHVLNGKDVETGNTIEWTGRKWFLSPYMCKNEIVTTAFKAVMTAMEHEVREMFRYKGVNIFNPHLDPDKMAEFVKMPGVIQERENTIFGL